MSIFRILRMMVDANIKPQQHIIINDLPEGRVLDIGGGGEGVLARLCGKRVIAIDKYFSEIREACEKAPEAGWLTADGAHLPFEDGYFDQATAFFSCMYMTNLVKERVFKETRRVVKQGGLFWIWDVPMSARNNIFAIRLKVESMGKPTLQSAYGVGAKDQSTESFCNLLQKEGFDPQIVSQQKHWFLIKARRS